MRADWIVLDGEGNVAGAVSLPLAVDLMAIRDGRAYGTHQDGESDPMVVVYKGRS